MTEQPLYPKVVAGYEENERGEDALVLARRVVERDGGELNVVHVEKGSPADAFQESATCALPGVAARPVGTGGTPACGVAEA